MHDAQLKMDSDKNTVKVGIMPDYYNFEMHDWGCI